MMWLLHGFIKKQQKTPKSEMEKQHISKTTMAQQTQTSRSALNRLLDPNCESVTLQTLDKAARCLGRRLKVTLA